MKKSTVGVLAMLVMAAAMALIPAPEVSAQSPLGSRTARDEWLLDTEYPFYIIVNSPELDDLTYQSAIWLNRIGQCPEIDGAFYLANNNMLYITFRSEAGAKAVVLLAYKTKEEALKDMALEEGWDKLGPFELGTTNAAMQKSLERILVSIKSFKETGIFPREW